MKSPITTSGRIEVPGITPELLAGQLAERVMGWTIAPDRFMTGNRSWISRWRFQPTERLEDAFSLLENAKPDNFSMIATDFTAFSVKVTIKGKVGYAEDASKPRAITIAVARALGLEV